MHRDDPDENSTICYVTLKVTDTGCGISEEFQRNHLYEQFRQESTHSVGSGLGLSIVRQVTEELNGTVDIVSEKGKGTVATVRFPCELVVRSPSPEGSKPLDYLAETVGRVKEACQGLTVCFVNGSASSDGLGTESLGYSRNSVANVCSEWFKLDVKFVEKMTSNPRHINVLDQEYLRARSFRQMQDEIEQTVEDPEHPVFPPTIFIGAANFVAKLHKDPRFRAGESLFFVTNP